MMESKRVYVGGLYHEASEKDLRQLFCKFGDVESIEIKKRSENNVVNFVFAYVNIKTTDPQITQCFKRLNGTFWKGRRLKLELAKESFLARLQREREQSGRREQGPPRRSSQQERILERVLSAERRRSSGGASGVVDFTEETPGPAPVSENGTADGSQLEEEHGSASKRRKRKRSAEPDTLPPAAPEREEEDEPPSRGALKMFGGIGGPAAPVSPARPAADFLSRLEAFSAVWGDDGDGTAGEPLPTAPVAAARPQPVKTAAEDNERRMASLRLKQEAFQSQKRALQLALSAKADAPRPNKRIVFEASEDEDEARPASEGHRGPSLFGEEEDEAGEADDFRIRPQYEGEKGHKLRSLQERFGADPRFTLDERFAEDGRSEEREDGRPEEREDEDGVREEHRHQMDILDAVLGTTAAADTRHSRAKRNSETGPVRFDPSLESHAQYQLDSRKKSSPAADRSVSDAPVPRPAAAPAAPAYPGTFYQVTPQLGELFSRRSQAGAGGGFSLLKMMGRDAHEDDERGDEEYKTSEIKAKGRHPAVEGAAANPFRYDSSSSEEETEGTGTAEPPGIAGGGWTQTRKFFFQPDDQRLREGLEWVRAAPSAEELRERAERQRPELVELFRTMRHSGQRSQRRGRGRRRSLAAR